MRSALGLSGVVNPGLRADVLHANLALYAQGLARFTFGNASAFDRSSGLVVIKPSGVPYGELTIDALVVTDLTGRVIEGSLRPSSDLATHLELYKAWPAIGGVVHTHSRYATAWAQTGRAIPCFGTTHADAFQGSVPVTRWLSASEIAGDYEAETGRAIVQRFVDVPQEDGAALVPGHASFCWGASVAAAVEVAAMLEEVARLAYYTVTLWPAAPVLPEALRARHYDRKHGPAAYYGQPSTGEEGR